MEGTSSSESEGGASSGRSLRVISQGATFYFGGRIVSQALLFILNFLLTRTLGSVLYGIYAYASTITGFFMVFARLGTGKSILRFLPEYADDPGKRNWVVGIAYLTALFSSIIIGIALYTLAPAINNYTLDTQELVPVLRILAIVLPFNTLLNLTGAVFRGIERMDLQVVVSFIGKPLIKIGSVVVAIALGHSLIGIVAALAIGAILTAGFAFSLLYRETQIRPTGRRTSGDLEKFYNFSFPLTLKDLGAKLYTRVDILMIGFFLTGSAVGIYRVSILLSSFLKLPLSGINQLFPPVASDLHSNGNHRELEEVYQIVTRWSFSIVIPPALAMIVYSQEALRLFGDGFSDGSMVLILFTIAQLTNCAVGPSGYLLMMTDHQYLNLVNQWTLGVSNVLLNYLLLNRFGFIGAAAATAGSLAVINVIRVIEVWYFEGMNPYSSKFGKPILAGLLSVPVMASLKIVLSDYVLLIAGSALGLVTFVFLLVLFGFEDEDKEFYIENIQPYLRSMGN